ncbi:MAG TPA: glucosyl-3-phosphoglycerate synthase [Thermoleophilaceae bacterium]|nr:glucosyl-3-phosphoglycerate synthase [Thermoleophilaceae bacterium]
MTSAERARAWSSSRTFHHSQFPPERLAAERTRSVSVCVPARNEERTVGTIVSDLVRLRELGAVDEVVVIDGGSSDGTVAIAEAAGATVYQEAELMPEYGEVLGKGDAMWRALSVLEGEAIVYLDADSEGFGPHYACGLAGPLVCGDSGVEFVKAFYRRPFKLGEVSLPEGGGRVTELTARPLLGVFYPELAAFRQPLSGELAATRDLLTRLTFATGYAVEIAMLIDAWKEVGLDALAQVDIELRQNRHQPLSDLSPMADAVLRAVCVRLEREGRLDELEGEELVERPPLIRTAPPPQRSRR